MEVLLRFVTSVLSEPSVVHEKIGLFRQRFHFVRRTSVDRVDNLKAWPRLLNNLARHHCFPLYLDLFAHLKLLPQRTLRDAQPLCLLRVKPAGSICLDNSVGETHDIVQRPRCLDLVPILRYFCSRLELCDSYREVCGES